MCIRDSLYRYEGQINILRKTIDRPWVTFTERGPSLKHTGFGVFAVLKILHHLNNIVIPADCIGRDSNIIC